MASDYVDGNQSYNIKELNKAVQFFPNITKIWLVQKRIDCLWLKDILPIFKPVDIEVPNDCGSNYYTQEEFIFENWKNKCIN